MTKQQYDKYGKLLIRKNKFEQDLKRYKELLNAEYIDGIPVNDLNKDAYDIFINLTIKKIKEDLKFIKKEMSDL